MLSVVLVFLFVVLLLLAFLVLFELVQECWIHYINISKLSISLLPPDLVLSSSSDKLCLVETHSFPQSLVPF